MKLKLCNNGLSVYGTREDGATVSYSLEAEEYKQWLSEGNTPEPEFTQAELEAKELQAKLSEAKSLLDSTQFKFGDDYDKKDTHEWLALKDKRQEAREFIRLNNVVTP